MRVENSSWEIIFDGSPNGLWGRYILPQREQHPSEIWNTSSKRKYTKTGKHRRGTRLETENDSK